MYLQTIIYISVLLLATPLCAIATPYGDSSTKDAPTGNIQDRELKEVFGKEWKKAAERVQQHRPRWNKIFESLDADVLECEAIIFPEQLRYSCLQNGMEEGATIALYVKGGTDAANFSVGYFQMKPSFVEEVEAAWMKSPLRHKYKLYFDVRDSQSSRQKRLKRLLDVQWQCVYLGLFYRLVRERIPELEELSGRERVIIMATAYNRDFDASLEQLRLMREDYMFHTDIFPSENTEYYSYGEISAQWYSEIIKLDY